MRTEELTIRSIQHYMYCPHRWGLMEIDIAWNENYFVTKANLMHKRVHVPNTHYTLRGRKVYTSVPVYNDLEEYNLYGVADCLECLEDESGVSIDGSGEKYKICIVEYKPTKPEGVECRPEDLMQVFAQKICVDYIFHCSSTAVIYYGDVKKRYNLPVNERYHELDEILRRLLMEMRRDISVGCIPPIRKGQKCSGCSMKDLCIPTIKRKSKFREKLMILQDTMPLDE